MAEKRAESEGLDPSDWAEFRAEARRMLDASIDQLQQVANRPWQQVPTEVKDSYAVQASGQSAADMVTRITDMVLPYHGGNIHPRFWGWVQGSGLASDLISGMAGAVINANTGGRDHGANYMERAVIAWTGKKMGMPEGTSGVLVTGTSQATVIAFQAARVRVMPQLRQTGQNGVKLTAYAAQGVHNATRKALELLGVGAENLRLVPLISGQMDLEELRRMVGLDRAGGAHPFLLVGMAGSVDLGTYDNLNALADLAKAEELWLHVDGAFGAWTRIASEPWRSLSDGIGRADSIALDFHKWMYVGYDCGLVLIADEAAHRSAFALRPAYLEAAEHGLAGGDPWFCDYGVDLSRGNRALKVWTALEMYGEAALGAAITDNCRLAAKMAQDIETSPNMYLAAPVVSNVCVFSARRDLEPQAQSVLNSKIAQRLQESGDAVFSTTRVKGVVMLRAAITNHRSREIDIKMALAAVAQLARDG